MNYETGAEPSRVKASTCDGREEHGCCGARWGILAVDV
jgi:hypothetical protein